VSHARFAPLALLPLLVGCAASGRMAEPAEPRSATAAAAPVPPPLDRSLFSRDARGAVGEEDLQRILDARLDLAFPARLGVVALAEPFRAEAGAGVGERGIVAEALTRALRGATPFAQVTDVSTDLPNPEGIEGLRTIAARYRVRYLLLASARVEDRSHLNNWAWLYPTGIGLLAAPGWTVEGEGLLQASLFDAKTGTVLFTASEPFRASGATWLVGSGREERAATARALGEAARRIAKDVLADTDELVAWADRERRQRDARAAGAPDDGRAEVSATAER
jgi:hypothetical protein